MNQPETRNSGYCDIQGFDIEDMEACTELDLLVRFAISSDLNPCAHALSKKLGSGLSSCSPEHSVTLRLR